MVSPRFQAERELILKTHVVVSGGGGFLGRAVARLLPSYDVSFEILDRETLWSALDRIRETMPEKIVWINCVTLFGRKGEGIQELHDANVHLVQRICRILESVPGAAYIHADTLLPPGANAYSATRAEAREWLKSNCKSLRRVNCRIATMVGPGMRSGLLKDLLDAERLGTLDGEVRNFQLTSGEQLIDWVDVRDVARALCLVMSSVERFDRDWNEFEIGTGKCVSLRQSIERAQELLKWQHIRLIWGGLDQRKGAQLPLRANTQAITALGWTPKYTWDQSVLAASE